MNNKKKHIINTEIKKTIQHLNLMLHKAKLEELGVLEEIESLISKCERKSIKNEDLESYFGDFYDILPYALRNISLDDLSERKKILYDRADSLVDELNTDRNKLKKLQERYYNKRNPRDYFLLMILGLPVYVGLRAENYSHKELTSKDLPKRSSI